VTQVVLARSDTGTVDALVTIEAKRRPRRQLTVRYGPRGGLVDVDDAAGLSEVLGDFAATDVVPGGVGALPDRPLRRGDRWKIDERVTLPDGASRVTGHGTLSAIGSIAGRPTARVRTTTRLPVRRRVTVGTGLVEMVGSQEARTDARYAIRDGTLHRAAARISGDYVLVLQPPLGETAAPVQGSLELRIRTVSVLRGRDQPEPTTTTRSAFSVPGPGGGVGSARTGMLGPRPAPSTFASRSKPARK
jgi:hypothetical protein